MISTVCSNVFARLMAPAGRRSLTSLGGEVEVFVDGTEEVLLLAAELPGPEDIPHALVEVRVLALRRRVVMATGSGRGQGERTENSGTPPPSTQNQFSHLGLHHV